jgi:hypothetical protein
VAEQTKTDHGGTVQGTSQAKQIYISGYNEELTEKVREVVGEIYPGAAVSGYADELTEACMEGTVDAAAQQIMEDSGNPEGYSYISCDMGGEFDKDALYNGLNNEKVRQETITSFWTGAVAGTDGYKVYLFFEK